MKTKFIQRGIFVPRGYQLNKNSLSVLPRIKTICLEGCRYDVVRNVAKEMGFEEVGENDVWNIIWTDIPISLDKALEMRRFQDAHSIFWGTASPPQKANHFPGMGEICRKDRLARNLNRMKKSFPREYDFFPKTWSLPADISDLLIHSRTRRNSTYICKPDSGCQGRGIFLVRHLKKINPFAKLICQVYIPRPFLIDGYKFDLRIYILITSCDPLHIYIYNEGIARFATVKYEPPSDGNVDVIFMHLTNYSLNKFSQSYAPGPEGSKRKMSSIIQWMEDEGMDVPKLLDDIDALIVKTMIAAQPTLRHYYRASFPKHDRGSACFEILGFDILLDQRLKPFLLEVNHSPSFNLDLPVDAEIKEQLLRDTFNKIYLGNVCDKRGPFYKPKYRVETPTSSLFMTDNAGHSLSEALEIQFKYEDRHQGNFRLIYPTQNYMRYSHFFEQTASPAMVHAALLAQRRDEASKGIGATVSYEYPPLVPKHPYVVTRTIDKDGTVSTSKKNPNLSFMKVPYYPGEDDDPELYELERMKYSKPKDYMKDPRLHDIMCPIGPTGQREPLTILEGNPRRNWGEGHGMYRTRNSMSMENLSTTIKTVRMKSPPVQYLGDTAANNDSSRNIMYKEEEEQEQEIEQEQPTTLYEDALNHNELGMILGGDNRIRTRRHRKVIAKEILEQVQQNRGILMMEPRPRPQRPRKQSASENFGMGSFGNADLCYNLPIPPKVDNNFRFGPWEFPTTNDTETYVFKYPTDGKDLASSLSPTLSPYPYQYRQGEPHGHEDENEEQITPQQKRQTHDHRSYLDKIREMNENQDKYNRQPMQNFFQDSNQDLKTECDRVLKAVRSKRVRQKCLLTGDKAALIHQWMTDSQSPRVTETLGETIILKPPRPPPPGIKYKSTRRKQLRKEFTSATTYKVHKHGGHGTVAARPDPTVTQKPIFYTPRPSQPPQPHPYHQIVQGRPPHLRNL